MMYFLISPTQIAPKGVNLEDGKVKESTGQLNCIMLTKNNTCYKSIKEQAANVKIISKDLGIFWKKQQPVILITCQYIYIK